MVGVAGPRRLDATEVDVYPSTALGDRLQITVAHPLVPLDEPVATLYLLDPIATSEMVRVQSLALLAPWSFPHLLPDEHHATVFPAALARGLVTSTPLRPSGRSTGRWHRAGRRCVGAVRSGRRRAAGREATGPRG
jgi:hypothetical protein